LFTKLSNTLFNSVLFSSGQNKLPDYAKMSP
jgi:hypothetical protein